MLPVMVQVYSYYLAPTMAFGRAWGGGMGRLFESDAFLTNEERLFEGLSRGVMPGLNLFAHVLFPV
jgi:hypothetical protein